MIEQYLKKASQKMETSLTHLADELSQLRGGRATTGLLDGVRVDVYGQATPIKAIASINTPDAKSILITPWDKTNLAQIEKAITQDSNLGLSPSNDGNMIKINLPPLTQERREQLTKLVADKLETCKVSMRNARHEILTEGRRKKVTKELTEDNILSLELKLNDLINEKNKQADKLFESKKLELMEV